MKKIIYFAAMLLTLAGCSKDEIGGTATESMAGQWHVTIDAAAEDGTVAIEDFFGIGRTLMLTYNSAANNAAELIVDDIENFWNFQVKTVANPADKTFASVGTANNNLRGDDIFVEISGGKILPKAGHQLNGSVADSIVFYVSFSDDTYPATYGYKNYKVSGVRYSGLEDNGLIE